MKLINSAMKIMISICVISKIKFVKEHLINNTFFMYYCYRLLLVIKCDCRSAIYRYDGNFYLRHSCNTDKVMASDDEVLRMLTDNDRNCINRTLKHQWL